MPILWWLDDSQLVTYQYSDADSGGLVSFVVFGRYIFFGHSVFIIDIDL